MYQVHIDDLVPQNNFYRLLDKELDLHFLYKATAHYYGYEGQESIDPKHVLMAALTYNLKKYLKFVTKKAISKTIAIIRFCFFGKYIFRTILITNH